MTIAILPARLANQIAAGEVVERPASVIKELVENSLDAGATRIEIDIEKGGAKRIRITDNGVGIVKDELTLALSRHATSKIKNLDDLEAISSLGFRGEALASISSVARLTLTSKPATQDSAWQAHAEGREMNVILQPAAHPDGTTIDVVDLFFNTPARRKFLRTEKTEFAHIEEVIKRIALARFDVTFILNHNAKVIKHYRAVKNAEQNVKRIAAVCGQRFVEHATFIDCQHDDIHLMGWIAEPGFIRNQNDLAYSYVNGRMMRDKLINHAIRQAYGEFIGNDVYPAFVLFLSLDFKDVDVNVHPSKHEVRFHQGRYVHDFIYSVCHKALVTQQSTMPISDDNLLDNQHTFSPSQGSSFDQQSLATANQARASTQHLNDTSYIQPLTPRENVTSVNESVSAGFPASAKQYAQQNNASSAYIKSYTKQSDASLANAAQAYQNLMSVPSAPAQPVEQVFSRAQSTVKLLQLHQDEYGLYLADNKLYLCALKKLASAVQLQSIMHLWPNDLVSQPLLLPVKVTLTNEQLNLLHEHHDLLTKTGLIVNIQGNTGQIRQFPALLREQDVTATFSQMLAELSTLPNNEAEQVQTWQITLAKLASTQVYTLASAEKLWLAGQTLFADNFVNQLRLNSVPVDLTSSIEQLT